MADSDENAQAKAERESSIAADIRIGLDAGEFEPFFQPIVSLSDRRITGFESLARWRNPTRGLVQPAEFVAAAEATGLIREIDTVILQRAWRTLDIALDEFPQAERLLLSVNLSARHFQDADIVDAVRRLMAEGHGQKSCLQVEITETLLINNTESAEQILTQLKALGVVVALDDFGTGYSSLVYLHRFPIDCIKIDRSFSKQLISSDRSRAIVRSIIGLAASMGLRSVAEGVEEEAVVSALADLGCQYAQGTYFSVPLPEAGLRELLERTSISRHART